MRYISLILLCIVTASLQAQATVTFRTGDHIYYMESPNDFPIHYQVDRENDMDGLIAICHELTMYGLPETQIAFDPAMGTYTIRRVPGGNDRVVAIADLLNPSLIAVNTDTASQPIYADGRTWLCASRYLEIPTPHLTRATSFLLATNHRVFVFVTNPQIKTEL